MQTMPRVVACGLSLLGEWPWDSMWRGASNPAGSKAPAYKCWKLQMASQNPSPSLHAPW